MTDLQAAIDIEAGKLARLQELDQTETMNDADMLGRYRETVEAVRVQLVRLRDQPSR